MLLDRDVGQSTALVVDGNPTTRSVLTQHLRSFGFGTVKQANKIFEARDMLEHRAYDLVLCDHEFNQGRESGQDLLDELRREQMLPYSTVFVMVTGEATYQKVAEAAEAALDSYLIKPFSANTLFERLKEARQRKRLLKPVFDALEAREHEQAAAMCLERFSQRQLYWLYAARIGAEVLINQKRNLDARKVYEAVLAAKATPWARLGIARTQLAEGEITPARRTLEALVAELPQYADAYDVLGRVNMEQGQLGEALQAYASAVSITPACILRLQHCGTLHFYTGDAQAAAPLLERAWAAGCKSRLFDVLSMTLLALLRYDKRDDKGLHQASEVIQRFADKHPQSLRLGRMATVGKALEAWLGGQHETAIELASTMAADAARPDFDMEAATNTLSLWVRLDAIKVGRDAYAAVVRQIARRFSVSKLSTEILMAALRGDEEAMGWVRETHAEVMQLAEGAMNHALRGQPQTAVKTLLEHGQSTGNAKLIEMAGLVAHRHRERIDDVDGLLRTAGTLTHRYCMPSTHIAGVRRSNRSAGGLVLRR